MNELRFSVVSLVCISIDLDKDFLKEFEHWLCKEQIVPVAKTADYVCTHNMKPCKGYIFFPSVSAKVKRHLAHIGVKPIQEN